MSIYALVNTMDSTDTVLGSIVSRHRTIDAANKADSIFQRQVKRANGANSYIPTIVVERVVCAKDSKSTWARRSHYRTVDRYESEESC